MSFFDKIIIHELLTGFCCFYNYLFIIIVN